MKKIICIMIIILLSVIIPIISVSAFEREVYDFDKVWYHPEIGFNKNGDGVLVLAVTYANYSFRTIDYAHFTFTSDPFFLSIEFQDELEIIRDPDTGEIIYQEPSDGYLFLSKPVVDDFFPDSIKRFASKNLKYSVIFYSGQYWYRIHVPDFNRVYEWKEYIKPDKDEKWFTWGSSQSIEFGTRAMFIELIFDDEGKLIFDFSHASDNSSQIVIINKSYLNSKGISNPYFEWEYKSLSFDENETHYFINPPHFSTIGIHEASSGFVDTDVLCDETPTETIISITTYDEDNVGSYWQSFNENYTHISKFDVILRPSGGFYATVVMGLAYSDGTSIYGANATVYISGNSYKWYTFNIPDTYIPPGETYRIKRISYVGYNPLFRYNSSNVYSNGSCSNNINWDWNFKLYGYVGDRIYVNSTNRTAGDLSERNIVTFTVMNCSAESTNVVKIKVPVSDSVHAIIEVLNQTSMITATMVNSTSELLNNTFFYDVSAQFVYIGTTNLSIYQTVNWSVNCTYMGEFLVNFPSFKEVGDDIVLQGVIKDPDGNGIDGVMARTYIFYQNGTIAVGPIDWNCTGGNFHATISTTSLIPGIYGISIQFVDEGTGLMFKKGGDLYLSFSAPPGVYSDALVFFNFYNTNIGLGLIPETFKVYVNGMRNYENRHYGYIGETINITIYDYYDFTMYSNNYTINQTYTGLNFGLTFHEYDFTNANNEYFYASFLKQNATRWYERVVASSGGQKSFMLPTGNYTVRVYNADNSSYVSWNETINRSKAYLIGEDGVTLIIQGQSVIRGDLLEFREDLDYALMPDSIIWMVNPPIIFSAFDRTGMMLGQNIWKVCPAQNVIATTRSSTFGNWINSTALIPSNGTVENGTITVLEDSLYIFGNGSVDWVNITYTDNRTLKMNVSYVPGVLRIFGENLTINASGDINVYRETTYNQLKKFYWDIYNSTTNPGHIQGRAGYHRAGLEISNPLDVTIYDVYVFAGFSDKTNPDVNSVRVNDVDNGALLERGEHFKTTADGVEFRLTGSINGSRINATSSRNFVVSYYRDFADSYIYDDGRVYRRSFETGKIYGNETDFYNYVNVMFINDRKYTFRGGVFVILDFDDKLKGEIDASSIILHDENNNCKVDESNYVPGSSFVIITSDVIGDLSPGSSRTFGIYFLESSYPGADPLDLHLNTPIADFGIVWTPFLIIFVLLLIPMSYGIVYMLWDRKYSKTHIAISTLSFAILIICWILSVKGL